MEYTQEELAQLTDEEREALLADDEGTDEGEGDDAGDGAADGYDDGADDEDDDEDDQGEGDDDSDEGEGDEAGEGEGSDEGEGDSGTAEAGGADDAEADASDTGPTEQQAPQQQAPVDFNAALATIDAQLDKIEEQYDEGELTARERRQQARELEDQRVNLIVAQREAYAAAQRAHEEQNRAVDSFLAEVGIPRDDNDPRFAAYDKCVIKVANDPASAQLSARAILEKAHALYAEQFGIQSKAPAKEKAAKPVKPRVDLPPTPTDEGSRFAWLDRLDPVTREAEVAKLSPADLDSYLTYS
jgi:hypothetical protein